MRDSGIEWIGHIPEHWETIKLKYYTSKIGSGVTPTGGAEVYQENGVIFLRSQNIHNDGLRLEDAAYISDEIDQQMSNSRVCFGDVLLNITGASIGRCHCFDRNIRANVNQHVCIIRPDASKLNCKYLQYILNSDMGQILIKLGESGANREGLTFEQIKNFVIPICDISEQKQIVDVIVAKCNSINQTIDSLKQNVACLAQYKASLISEAVTGQIDVRDWREK
jgi:type I restriction enzyme S subunit